jgi:TP901 family phage tail tape measure protein
MPNVIVKAAGRFAAESAESAFAGVKKTVDASEAEFASLRKQLTDLSEDIPVSFSDLSGITEMAGQLGVDNSQLIKFTETIAALGVSTNLTGEEAAVMLAQYANVTGMDLSNIDRLGSVIVQLGNNVAPPSATSPPWPNAFPVLPPSWTSRTHKP